MKALLRTRCGCTKMIDIPEMRLEIRLPLVKEVEWVMQGFEPKPTFDYRVFLLHGTSTLPYGSGDVTVYVEAE